MKVSKVALAAATVFGGSALLAAPALAQQPSQAPAAQAEQRQLRISRTEQAALTPLEAAVRAQNWAAAQAALPAAQAAAQGEDARYFVARATWQIGNQTRNQELELQGLAQLIGLAGVPANERTAFLHRQAELAFGRNDFATAERAYARLIELNPADSAAQNNLAIVRRRMGNTTGATETLLQAINRREAAGERVEQATFDNAIRSAYQAQQRPQVLDLLRRRVAAYPTPTNWRDALLLYRDFQSADASLDVDVLRMVRAARAMNGQGDYLLLARQLDQAGLPGEAKAVIDEGVAAGALQAGDAEIARMLANSNRRIAEDRSGLTSQIAQARSAANGRPARIVADALYGYGRYAEAAELYRVALTKGGEDANTINTRLGATLALAGQRAEAEAALRAVTGPRAELAQYWLLWLQRRPA